MREITTHHTNEANKAIEIVADERDVNNGNASHVYTLKVPNLGFVILPFQEGPVAEVGVNGITNEALLAVVIDRLQGFQSSKYACPENERARKATVSALWHLESRTKERKARGVEGTRTP